MAVFWPYPKCSACISRNVHSGNNSLSGLRALTNRTCLSCKHLCLRISYGHFLLEQGCSSLNGEPCHHTNARILFPGNGISRWSICTVWCLALRGVLVYKVGGRKNNYILYANYNHRSTDYFGDSTTCKRSHIIQDNAFSEKFGIPLRRRDNPVIFWIATLLVFLIGASFLAISCLQIIRYLR